jgi:glutamyl-Q tRNA(Asp) synthetase
MPIITRFAPSPTGLLHLGHARAALFAWERGDKVLLRLEDIDPGRCRLEYADAIRADLAWLGLHPDGPVRVQSCNLAEYRAVLDDLVARGLAYPCFCTRADIAASAGAPHGPDGAPLYPGACRTLDPALRADRLARGDRHALRLDMAAACALAGPLRMTEAGQRLPCRPEAFGDVVLARKDAPASYHLCATHDDAVQGVTLVTRGEDLRPAASLHRLLQALMEWPEPAYAHHPLLLDAAGRRLSKRDGAVTLRALREGGAMPEDVRRMVA